MSQARTNDMRHWVRIYLNPIGQYTPYRDIDLVMVDGVNYGYSSEHKKVVAIILYAGSMKSINLTDEPCEEFMKIWNAYLGYAPGVDGNPDTLGELKAITPKPESAKESLIQVSGFIDPNFLQKS